MTWIAEPGELLPTIPAEPADEEHTGICNGTSWRIARYGTRVFRIADPHEATPVPFEDRYKTPGLAAAGYASLWQDLAASTPRLGDLIEVQRPGRDSQFIRVYEASGSHDVGWTITGMVSFCPGGPNEPITLRLRSGAFTWLSRELSTGDDRP